VCLLHLAWRSDARVVSHRISPIKRVGAHLDLRGLLDEVHCIRQKLLPASRPSSSNMPCPSSPIARSASKLLSTSCMPAQNSTSKQSVNTLHARVVSHRISPIKRVGAHLDLRGLLDEHALSLLPYREKRIETPLDLVYAGAELDVPEGHLTLHARVVSHRISPIKRVGAHLDLRGLLDEVHCIRLLANRLSTLVIEHALSLLPYREKRIETPLDLVYAPYQEGRRSP
jgi:hypothetical protein